ncbi:MAG TPA: alkaline phosphatase family protein [Terracidiphilus sp.]|jgi:predicted AlkP superfamily pyrophosphatase or phosphodiesterase|nr:alkaline phosphatase family protein [Terracidiphilus sp.]
MPLLKQLIPLAATLAAALTFAANAQVAQNDGSAATTGPIVVMITIDGFPARALNDPRLPMPTLRMLEANGTHADAMQPINPTVTWPNHTALITGVDASVHHVIANGLVTFPVDGSAPEIKPWVPKDDLVHARTLYDAAAEKGMTTGQVDWVAIYGAKNVRWEFGEKPSVDSAIAKDLVAQKLVTEDQVETFGAKSSPAWRDEIWTDAAIDILTRHTPNLLLLHLLETDTLQHEYAPLTPAAYAAYAYADSCIARVVDAARSTGLLDRITFVLTSDHGFETVAHEIRPNVALAERGLLQMQGGSYKGNVWFLAEGGEASLFIRDDATRATLVKELKEYFTSMPGIAGAYTNDEAQKFGIPASGSTDQAPDLYLAAQPSYSFTGGVQGPIVSDLSSARGTHGYLNTNPDMEALFIASGAHIRPGVDLGSITNLRVAPTLAKILGVSLPAATQQPLIDALQ